MTWQAGKLTRGAIAPVPAFARLRPLAMGQKADLQGTLKGLSQALRDFGSQVRIHIQLLPGSESKKTDHWEVEGGSSKATARHGRPKTADVHVVMQPETWNQIAAGQLAPYDALLG